MTANKIISFLIFSIVSSCVTADKNQQNLKMHSEFEEFKFLLNDRIELVGKNFSAELLIFNSDQNNIFKKLIHSVVIDNPESAYYHLAKNYYIASVVLRNNSAEPIDIDLNKIKFKYQDRLITPLPRNLYPKKLTCINWKGSVKNIYNTTIIVGATAYVALAIAACLSEGKCEGLKNIEDIIKLSTSGETDENKIYSKTLYKHHLKSITFMEHRFSINANETKEGIVFFKKNTSATDSVLLGHNCFVTKN